MSSSNGVLPEGAMPARGYEVIAPLSRGRDMEVYDAWSLERDCRCALKLVRPDRRKPKVSRRLAREGDLLLRLAHPHLVRAYDLVRRPRMVLVLETLDGQTLEHMVKTVRRRLAVADVAHLGLQLSSAVRYLHGHDHLHLDVKPANVIAQNGQAKLIDLSLSRRPGPVPRGCGTPAYLSPEQAQGGVATAAADVWGIGATMYYAATGEKPFPDAAPRHYPQATRPAPSVTETRRVPRTFAAVLDACLAPAPADRPSVPELADELDELIGP
jgi:eukaryotic-like serine/threonine-protein kinase